MARASLGSLQVEPAQPRLDARAARGASALSMLTGLYASFSGLMVLTGYALDQDWLKSGPIPGLFNMKANTAFGLMCAGLALTLLRCRPRADARTWAGRGFAVLATLLGSLTLLEHLTGFDLGIDQLLFVEPPGELATLSPGRMGPPAACSFFLLGLSLLFLDRVTARRASPAQWLALLVLLLTTMPLLGYLTEAEQLFLIARVTGIALPTASALFALAVGVLLARPEARPASVMLADNAGGQLARSLLPITLFAPLLFSALRLKGQALGLFDAEFGRALVLLAMVLTFASVVWIVSLRFSHVAAARSLAEQATSRVREEAERLASEHLQTVSVLDSLLAHAPIGLVFFEKSRVCVRVNDYILRLGRIADGSVLTRLGDGTRLRRLGDATFSDVDVELVLPGKAEGLDAAIERLFKGEPNNELELVRMGADGEPERTWLMHLFPVRDDAGSIILAGAVLIDISERKRLEAQRVSLLESERSARQEAQRAADLKDEFLATLSHELRTPLNAVLGWVTVALGKPDLTAELKRALDIVERNARLQAQLIEDLLDVSRIVSGKMRVEAQPVDLEAVVSAAVAAVTPTADAKQVDIETRILGELDGVLGDAGRLQQVLWNLLSNAVKFTPKGGHVILEAHADPEFVQLSVTDSGAGIRADFLPHVFERFRQADASTTRRHGGLGLGLAIVRQLVELHGGRVSAASPGEGQGATFHVSLPRRVDLSQARREARAREAKSTLPSLEGVNVLVVDDERDAREFVARVLEDRGAEVTLAESADEALRLLATRHVNVLVSDIGMSVRDGYDLVRTVRETHDAARLPAVALTAFARSEDKERALSAGFQVHLPKPIEPRALLQAVSSLWARR